MEVRDKMRWLPSTQHLLSVLAGAWLWEPCPPGTAHFGPLAVCGRERNPVSRWQSGTEAPWRAVGREKGSIRIQVLVAISVAPRPETVKRSGGAWGECEPEEEAATAGSGDTRGTEKDSLVPDTA